MQKLDVILFSCTLYVSLICNFYGVTSLYLGQMFDDIISHTEFCSTIPSLIMNVL
ncbi:hypothetical protein BDV29DRAFT_169641 [Aspergillus leporis]|uniref:Uncharacterized protein n=1 Tax=Aspergillus leporis TaxID=41062 RepID=A0A5N5XBW8_9EURO|nr:hypothetical protein BDV29DRAFT_169641 [Aspergillus leporis]